MPILLLICLSVGLEFSVSGFSSGAFMSMQLHLSHSSHIKGVGIIAGGPYSCLKSSNILSFPFLIDTSRILSYARSQAASSLIDPLQNLRDSKIFIQSGTKDSVVPQVLVKKVQDFYKTFTSNIKTEYEIQSHHAFLTDYYGNPCWFYGKPYISDCNFDTAGEILHLIYGDLNPRSSFSESNLFKFSQSDFESDQAGMADFGFVYFPANCNTKLCRIHVFLHGCGMNYEYISDAVYRHSGFNEWAEANDLIVIYPQAARHHPLNYGACWDAKGEFDPLFDTKQGKQVSSIFRITQQIYQIKKLLV